VLWDLCNPYFEKRETPETTHALLAPYVVSTHVKDAVEAADGKHDYRFLGEGEVPVRRMLELLVAGGYRGYAILEWEKRWRPALPEPEVAFPQFVAKMQEWGLDRS
jgi:fatty-acyl-CoA synthase